MRSRIAANEASAVASVRTIGTSQLTYFNSYNTYATTIGALGGANCNTAGNVPDDKAACLIDQSLATATAAPGKSGYIFAVQDADATKFAATADAATQGTSGVRHFCVAQDAVVRAGTAAVTTAATCIALTAL